MIFALLLLHGIMAVGQTQPVPQVQSTPLDSSASALEAQAAAAARPLIQVGPGDQIKVDVFGRPEMDTTSYVAEDGTIRLPLAGPVAVNGLSPTEAGKKIEDALRSGQYLVDPHVTVTVVLSRSQRVSVLGEVHAPGRYAIESNTTVMDLIAQVGGVNEKGADRIYILRADSSGQIQRLPVDLRGMSSPDAASGVLQTLRGGDSILVPRADQYYITGEIRSPAGYRLDPGMTVLEAIARAGGVTEKGSARRISIKRRSPNGTYVVVSGRPEEKIQPDDLITVKERLF